MKLGVNIDHIATLRNARGGSEPDVLRAALICEKAGAFGITTHLREDRRHIKDEDIYNIKKLNCKLNMEMAATDEMQKIALDVMPYACCIVPERRQEVTTEGGLDVAGQFEKIKEFVEPLLLADIKVSLFIDPDRKQVSAAADTGVKYVELHTGAFANAFGKQNEQEEFLKLAQATALGHILGLKVNAGHGLNYDNVYRMNEIDGLNELNIGHSIISKAIFVGLDNAVKDMINIINKS